MTPELLHTLAANFPTGENAALLHVEAYWYTKENMAEQNADDLKRETRPLTLRADRSVFSAILAAIPENAVTSSSLNNALRITSGAISRQPNEVVFVEDSQLWLSDKLAIEDGAICLKPDAELVDILRAAGLAARFPQLAWPTQPPGFTVNAAECLALPQSLRRLIFKRIILGRRPSHGLRLLDQFGLLKVFLPEVVAGHGLAQNRFHAHDIFQHLLHSVDGAFDLNEPVRWSALLHDIGKVPTRVETETGEATFHSHELYSARMIVPIMKRLAVPITIGQKVKFLVRNHMFHYTDEWSDKAVRRFVKKVPLDELQDLISLRLADRKGSGKKTAFPKALQKLIGHIDEIIAKEKEFKIKDLVIDGHTLMQMGMAPSRAMGDLLKYLFDEVKAGRANNTVEELTLLAHNKLDAANT